MDAFGEESLIPYINRVMGQESLLGLGYQIQVVSSPFGPEYPSTAIPTAASNLVGNNNVGYLAHVQLRDERGFPVQIEDVGTGVAQLVPVLEALYYSQAVIHQPELHLHPRLQSVLGDLLVERLAALSYAIVESHSEHLLLRVLRRIRESILSGGVAKAVIAPEDITVLYFDKQDDGITRVLRLRINSEGEFIDRWPHGFFTERDDDVLHF